LEARKNTEKKAFVEIHHFYFFLQKAKTSTKLNFCSWFPGFQISP